MNYGSDKALPFGCRNTWTTVVHRSCSWLNYSRYISLNAWLFSLLTTNNKISRHLKHFRRVQAIQDSTSKDILLERRNTTISMTNAIVARMYPPIRMMKAPSKFFIVKLDLTPVSRSLCWHMVFGGMNLSVHRYKRPLSRANWILKKNEITSDLLYWARYLFIRTLG